MHASYLKVKVLELLLYLGTEKIQNTQVKVPYFAHTQVKKVKEIQKYMVSNLRQHYTLEQLSEQFDIPLTSMKACFKGVFGCSIYKKEQQNALGRSDLRISLLNCGLF